MTTSPLVAIGAGAASRPIAQVLETTLSRHLWAVLSQEAGASRHGASGGGVLRHAQARSTREAVPGSPAVSAVDGGMKVAVGDTWRA